MYTRCTPRVRGVPRTPTRVRAGSNGSVVPPLVATRLFDSSLSYFTHAMLSLVGTFLTHGATQLSRSLTPSLIASLILSSLLTHSFISLTHSFLSLTHPLISPTHSTTSLITHHYSSFHPLSSSLAIRPATPLRVWWVRIRAMGGWRAPAVVARRRGTLGVGAQPRHNTEVLWRGDR